MNTYIKQLVESFFDDIDDDIIDNTADTLSNMNIDISIDVYVKQVNNFVSGIFNTDDFSISVIEYNKNNNAWIIYIDYPDITISKTNVKEFAKLCKLLSRITNEVYINDRINKDSAVSATLWTNQNNLILDSVELDMSNISIKNIYTFDAANTIIKNANITALYGYFENCDFKYANTCVVNIQQICVMSYCINIPDFGFLKTCKKLRFFASMQDHLAATKNFDKLPDHLSSISINFGLSQLEGEYTTVEFDPGNSLGGIPNSLSSYRVTFSGLDPAQLKHILSCISIEDYCKQSLNYQCNTKMSLMLFSGTAKIVIDRYTYMTIRKMEDNYLPKDVCLECRKNNQYLLGEYIKYDED